jgi:hypothetical protein
MVNALLKKGEFIFFSDLSFEKNVYNKKNTNL